MDSRTQKKRTRAGCYACKSRHKKCDETRPECNNCQRRGIQCPGFEKRFVWRKVYKGDGDGNGNDATSSSSEATFTIIPPPTNQAQGHSSTIMTQVDFDETVLPPNPATGPGAVFNPLYHQVAQPLPTRLANPEATVFQEFVGTSDNIYASLPKDIMLGSLDNASELPYEELDPAVVSSHSVPIIYDDSSAFSLSTQTQATRHALSSGWEVEQHRHMSNGFMNMTKEIPFVSTVLLTYYFDSICTVACTYDGPKNPFRTFLSARWQDSAVAFTSAQGIAAAAMARSAPELREVAVRARSEASATLASEIKTVMTSNLAKLNEITIAVLLMGVSSTWLNPDDVGLKFYSVATALMKLRTQRATRDGTSANDEAFFEQAITYWWMLLSLMVAAPEHRLEFPPHLIGTHPLKGMSPQEGASLPHPWAGVSTEAQVLLGTVASHAHSLRSRRKRLAQGGGMAAAAFADDDILADFVLVVTARDLEKRAMNLSRRMRDDIADPMDPEADVGEFVTVNEAYKSAILILIYRTFPQLRSDGEIHVPFVSERELRRHNRPQGPGINLELSDDDDDDDSDPPLAESPPQEIRSQPDLFQMSVHVLEMLGRFKKYSRILGLTPHLLIIAAGELRIHPTAQLDSPCCTFQSRPASVRDLRRFVLEFIDKIMKFFFFLHLERMRATVVETWRRADAGEKDAFWVDVMRDMGWQAVMG